MVIQLYNYTGYKNQITKDITPYLNVYGNLKEDTDIVNPTVVIEGYNLSTEFNYAVILQWGRSYFVTGIKQVHDKQIEISLHCDVLMSAFIFGNAHFKCIVSRTDAKMKKYSNFVDPKIKVSSTTYRDVITFPKSLDESTNILVVSGG